MSVWTTIARTLVFICSVLLLVISTAIVGFMVYVFVKGTQVQILNYLDQTALKVALYVLFAVCCLVLIMSLMGILGVCCSLKYSVKIYAGLQVIMIITMSVLLIFTAVKHGKLQSAIEAKLSGTFRNYKGERPGDGDLDTKAWNVYMLLLRSCALDSTFRGSWICTKWGQHTKASNGIEGSFANITGLHPKEYRFPFVCCKGALDHFSLHDLLHGLVTGHAIIKDNGKKDFIRKCYSEPSKNKNDQFTLGAVSDTFEKATKWMMLGEGVVVGLSVLLLASAIVIVYSDGGLEYQPM